MWPKTFQLPNPNGTITIKSLYLWLHFSVSASLWQSNDPKAHLLNHVTFSQVMVVIRRSVAGISASSCSLNNRMPFNLKGLSLWLLRRGILGGACRGSWTWSWNQNAWRFLMTPPLLLLHPQATQRPRSGRSGACVPSRVAKVGKWGHARVSPLLMGRCAAVPCGKRACATTPLPVPVNLESWAQVCVNLFFFCFLFFLSAISPTALLFHGKFQLETINPYQRATTVMFVSRWNVKLWIWMKVGCKWRLKHVTACSATGKK